MGPEDPESPNNLGNISWDKSSDGTGMMSPGGGDMSGNDHSKSYAPSPSSVENGSSSQMMGGVENGDTSKVDTAEESATPAVMVRASAFNHYYYNDATTCHSYCLHLSILHHITTTRLLLLSFGAVIFILFVTLLSPLPPFCPSQLHVILSTIMNFSFPYYV